MTKKLSDVQAREALLSQLERLAPALGLTRADLRRLVANPRIRTYQPGEAILSDPGIGNCLGLVVEGQVAVFTPRSGQNLPVTILRPGETFGQALFSGGRAGDATLRALAPCEIWFVCRADLAAQTGRQEVVPVVAHARPRAAPAAPARAESPTASAGQQVPRAIWWLAAALVLLVISVLTPLRRAVALVPLGLGQWCNDGGHGFCAEQSWLLAAAISPRSTDPLLALGGFYVDRGDLLSAEAAFSTAERIAPSTAEAHNNLGFLYAGRGDHQRAEQAFRRALQFDPGAAAAHYNLGLSLQALGDSTAALAHYRTALALGGPQGPTLANMAVAYFELGQLAQAAESASSALVYDDTLAPAYTVLGAVALRLRPPEEAISALRHAVSLDVDYGPAHYYLGAAYQALGQTAEARLAFERALALAADDETRARIHESLDPLLSGDLGPNLQK